MASKRLEDLHPHLEPLCREWLEQCADAGLNVKILMTYRTPYEQDEIYALGRTKPGKIVTSLKGRNSRHCFTIDGKPAAKAFDFGIFSSSGSYITDGSDHRYLEAGEIGEDMGLTWGGRWKKPFDPSHLEIN